MWLCDDKLKEKTGHFRLPSASQKRACLSSLKLPDDPAVPPSWETFLAALVILVASESIQQ